MAKSVLPLVQNFKDVVLDHDADDWIQAPTPTAKREYLVALDQLVLAAATTPYAMPLMAVDAFNDQVGTYWHYCYVYAPGTAHMRPYFTRTFQLMSSGAPSKTQCWAETTASSDRVDVPVGLEGTSTGYPITNFVSLDASSEVIDASPAAGDDHLLELTPDLQPWFEEHKCLYPVAIGGSPRQVGDLVGL